MALSPCPQPAASEPTYQRREPETTVLHALVRDHLEEFLEHARDTYTRPIPRYVENELRAYLKCGLVRYGFPVTN